MATLLLTNGTHREVKPQNGRSFSLAELHALIGNGCDCITTWSVIEDGKQLVAVGDDDAHLKAQKPAQNQQATEQYWRSGGQFGWVILGNVVVCTPVGDELR